MKRFFISILAAISFVTAQAHAGDQATLNVLGFSEDGAVFAFEEYGIQDGSGLPYVHLFYINTADDTFLAGSPIRMRPEEGEFAEDEIPEIGAVRQSARLAANAIGLPADSSLVPGFAAGMNAPTELSALPNLMTVNPRPVKPAIDAPLAVQLEEFPFPPTGLCEGMIDTVTGFRLMQIATEEGRPARLLHEDKSVPISRSCPTGYTIAGIYTYYPKDSAPVFAVMLAVESIGFEGPDTRWMAVTAALN